MVFYVHLCDTTCRDATLLERSGGRSPSKACSRRCGMTRMRAQPLAFALALFTAGGVAAVLSCAWPDADRWVQVGPLDDFPPGSVAPFGENIEVTFHVVRLDNGELLALSAQSVFHRPGCVAAYRPDFVSDDRAGWFRDTCYPFTCDMTGHVVDVWITPPISLDRLAVEVRNGTVYVNPREITPGRSRPLEGYEFQSGGTLMPAQHYSRRHETAVRTHRGAEPCGCAERSVPRQPEPARRDDVALDLRGATGDGLRHRKHVVARRPGRHRGT